MSRLRLLLFVTPIVACLASCASVTPLYGGPRRASDEVAVLRMVMNGAITAINGRELEGRSYELLPSKYAVEFRYILQGEEVHPAMKTERLRQRATYRCSAEIELQAGREYQISRKGPNSRLRPSGYEKNAGDMQRRGFYVEVLVSEIDADGKVLQVQQVSGCRR